MKHLAIFVVGLTLGAVLHAAAQSNGGGRLVAMNHVSISAHDFNKTVDFYQNVMGFKTAFSNTAPDGRPGLTYLQISRDTFVEVQPPAQNRPDGFMHFGIEVEDMDAVVARLRAKGAEVTDPNNRPGGVRLANITAPDGVRIELLELGPDSPHKKASATWK
jgi:catechol 2,3-dioxygenase-like lactoylglutathione lyase family enzyme